MKISLGWLLLLGLLGFVGYAIWEDEKNRPPAEVQAQIEAQNMAGAVKESCIKGVLYYYTTGPHSSRLAPAVDAEALTFKRCSK